MSIAPAALEPDPYLAVLAAETAFKRTMLRRRDRAAEIGVFDGSHGIIAEIVRIKVLGALSRKDEARAVWEASARRG